MSTSFFALVFALTDYIITLVIVVLYPLYYVVIASVSEPYDAYVILPEGVSVCNIFVGISALSPDNSEKPVIQQMNEAIGVTIDELHDVPVAFKEYDCNSIIIRMGTLVCKYDITAFSIWFYRLSCRTSCNHGRKSVL